MFETEPPATVVFSVSSPYNIPHGRQRSVKRKLLPSNHSITRSELPREAMRSFDFCANLYYTEHTRHQSGLSASVLRASRGVEGVAAMLAKRGQKWPQNGLFRGFFASIGLFFEDVAMLAMGKREGQVGENGREPVFLPFDRRKRATRREKPPLTGKREGWKRTQSPNGH